VGDGINRVIPTALKIRATKKPATGPFDPMSNNASLFGGNDFCIITAPKVPRGGIPGIKYGEVASTFFLFAVILCPIS